MNQKPRTFWFIAMKIFPCLFTLKLRWFLPLIWGHASIEVSSRYNRVVSSVMSLLHFVMHYIFASFEKYSPEKIKLLQYKTRLKRLRNQWQIIQKYNNLAKEIIGRIQPEQIEIPPRQHFFTQCKDRKYNKIPIL